MRVLGLLANGGGGEHGKRLANREHFRLAYQSPEVPTAADMALLDDIKSRLSSLVVGEEEAAKSWYKTGAPDIPVVKSLDPDTVLPLSRFSNVVLNMRANNQVLLYVKREDADKANKIVKEVTEYERNRQGSLGLDSSAS